MNRTPSVGTPFLDKISVTIPVPQDYWIEATENFFELSHIDSRLSLRRERYDSTRFKLYNFSWTFRTSTLAPQIVHIQILPKKSDISYMRIEWNPSKTGRGIFRYLINFLAAHIPQLEASARRTLITRVDIAVDVTGLQIGDIYAFSKSARTIQNSYFNGPNRSLSGMYLGTKKSARQLLIYDKNLKEYGENAVVVRSSSGRQWKRLVRPRTRIELRIHNLGDLVSHHTLSSQFEGYSLVDAGTVKTQQGRRFSAEFCANCEKYGAQLALSLYEPRVRARLRKFLNTECALPWYRPADWWLAGMTEIQRELGADPINACNAS